MQENNYKIKRLIYFYYYLISFVKKFTFSYYFSHLVI